MVVRVVGVVVIVTHVSVLLCLVIAGKSTTEIRFITVTYFVAVIIVNHLSSYRFDFVAVIIVNHLSSYRFDFVAVIIVNHLSSYRFDFFVIGAAVIATIIEAVSGESE